MFTASKKHLLLFLIVVFSFVYRMLLLHWQAFPPGADIGLHNSIIHSITASCNTNFLWNYYHMGGVTSLTFPGYHIFASYIIFMTGMPDYFAHTLVASLFSSLIVLCAFLITRNVWGESASYVVAFLVAISRFDIELLMWGGYPNVITLLLIPLVFYLCLEKARFSSGSFLVTTALLSGAIFLTHSLSSVMFFSITAATVVVISLLSKKVGVPKTRLLIWLAPLLLGVIIVFPFLLKIAPEYLGIGAEPFTGAVAAIRLAMLATRKLALELVLALLICVPFFLVFSRILKGKFFTVPAVLFSMWVLVPAVLTQGFLFGLYVDYHRFLYFIVLPILILIAISIDSVALLLSSKIKTHSSNSSSFALNRTSQTKNHDLRLKRRLPHLTSKNVYSLVIVTFIIVTFLIAPIFLPPYEGVKMSGFYQVTTEPSYDAIQWIRQHAPVGSILVSDALYGWWVSGFAQRPTLSAVSPQFLTLASEVEAAEIAKNLLDTNYVIDNGLIQVREDGGYMGRHNPAFSVLRHDNPFPYQFFHFNSGNTRIYFSNGGIGDSINLLQVPVTDMFMEEGEDYASIVLRRQNAFFNLTQKTTVYQGVKFVNMTITIDSADENITIYGIRFIFQVKEPTISEENDEPEPLRYVHINEQTMVIIDDNVNVYGQLIFTKQQPEVTDIKDDLSNVELHYNLGEGPQQIEMFVGIFQIKLEELNDLNNMLTDNIDSYAEKKENFPLQVFDYQKALRDNQISYILCRDSAVTPKFAKDPVFSLVFANEEVAIFMTKRNLK